MTQLALVQYKQPYKPSCGNLSLVAITTAKQTMKLQEMAILALTRMPVLGLPTTLRVTNHLAILATLFRALQQNVTDLLFHANY